MVNISKIKLFFSPEDLVEMGLYEDKNHVFRAINKDNSFPPYIRISKKLIRFPVKDFEEWIKQQTCK